MTRILGIDPGSRITGYGIIDTQAQATQYITSGCIRVNADCFPERLKQIFAGVREIAEQFQPHQLAIEQVFMHKNADSALKLGQARGAAICAAQLSGLTVYEYAARQVKKALVGKGNAQKDQVQHMVKVILGLSGTLQVDAGDALGICLCHAHYQQTQQLLKIRSV